MVTKKPFLVGHRTRRGTMVLFLRRPLAPIRGPFTLTAVVSPNGAVRPSPSRGAPRSAA
jgi:hypothetical protein